MNRPSATPHRGRSLLRRLAGDRGSTEVGVAVVGAALVVSAALGSGVASSVVSMSDGITWLPDDQTGELVQVNPGTGRAERRLTVAGPGAELDVSQQDGHLVVGDARTGTITSIDLATLLTGGQRRADEPTEVLVGGGQVYLVTPSTGVVRAVDPLSLRDLGTPHRVGSELVDVVVDREGTVWAVTSAGRLVSLTWRAEDRTFDTDETTVRGGGRATRLLPHDQGVTVFAPDGGAVLQVGAGRDLAVEVPRLEGAVLPAEGSPTDLAPAGLPDRSTVVLLSGDRVLDVGVGALGCERPGRPAVFGGLVYVPCGGAGRVVVLRPDGSRARPDIVVPGGRDPRLLVDDGRLVVHTEDGARAVMVEGDGTTRVIETGRGRVAAHDPNDASTGPASVRSPGRGEHAGSGDRGDRPALERRDEPASPGGGAAPEVPDARDVLPVSPTDGPAVPTPEPSASSPAEERPTPSATETTGARPTPSSTATDGARPTPTPSATATVGRPTGVTARLGPNLPRGVLQVVLTWTVGSPRPDRHVVRDAAGAVLAEVAGDATSAAVQGVPCDERLVLTVEAVSDDGGSAATRAPAVDTGACPGPEAPTGVTAVPAADGSVTVSWTPHGDVDSFLVGPAGGSTTTAPGDATSVVLRAVPPGDGVRFVVQAVSGGTTATSQPSAPITVPGPPGAVGGLDVSHGSHPGDGWTVRASWTAADDHGSPVTGYDVRWSGFGTGGSSTTTGTSASFSLYCADLPSMCTEGGTVTVTVTPRNALGDGPAADAQDAVAPLHPAPPARPQAGDTVVASVEPETPGMYEPAVEMTAHLAPPESWRTNDGECSVTIAPSSGPQTARSIGCAQTSVSLGLFSSAQSITVTVHAYAADGRSSVASAPVVGLVPPRNQWPLCFADTGICNAPARLADPDVVVVPVPWTPRLPHGEERPPLVAGGVGLLLVAGALRLARRRAVLGSATPPSTRPTEENPA